MVKFTFYWPELNNVHLTKDICLIPFILRKYYDYDCKILTHLNGPFPDAHNYLEDIPIVTTTDTTEFNSILADSDILMIVGYYQFNISAVQAYKQLNPNGIVYLKTDFNIHWINRIPIDSTLEEHLSYIDITTVECIKLCDYLNEIWPVKIEYLTQGYYNLSDTKDEYIDFKNKENTILTVGRLGTSQKSTETLVQAFTLIADKIPSWNLKLVGTCEDSFNEYMNNLFLSYPQLKSRIELTGPISNKTELKNIYEKSKIFCLTSTFESLPNVFPEAATKGCYIISTNIECSYDISNFGKYGSSFDVRNHTQLSEQLLAACTNEALLEKTCVDIQQYASDNFDWIKLCGKLDGFIKEKYILKNKGD